MPRNVFIDLGSHYGRITARFMLSPLYRPDFEIYCFEANPTFDSRVYAAYPPGCKVIKKAAWLFNGEIELYINTNRPNIQGSSVCREKITGNLDKDHPVTVSCIDFPAWLIENFSIDDNIIVKSNIEGAEYDLFDKMIWDGTIHFIKRLFLRTHWNKIGMPQAEHENFMARLMPCIPKFETEYNFK
jgi:FkbM family methyltransferase